MTIKQYMLENYEMTKIENITKHGCSGGIGGLIYYTETCAFHDQHETEIWDALFEDALAQDITILELIASFAGQKDVGSTHQFKNLLTWYAVERTAHEIINEAENNA